MYLNIELTKDGELLRQYYQLREKSFRAKLGISNFDGGETPLDRSSKIMIARIGNHCIGGIRICGVHPNVKTPRDYGSGLNDRHLSNITLQRLGYCQWMRCAICPEVGMLSMHIQNQFILATVLFSAALGYRYGFCASSRVHHRFYKRILSKHGYDYCSCDNIAVKKELEFSNLEHVLYVADLTANSCEHTRLPEISADASICLDLTEQESIEQTLFEVNEVD